MNTLLYNNNIKTYLTLQTSILVAKRFTGNKPIGHAHKLLSKIHMEPEFSSSNIINPKDNPASMKPIDQPYDTMFTSGSSPSTSDTDSSTLPDMSRFVQKGIVKHAKDGTGEEQLTKEAREIHRVLHMPKIQVKAPQPQENVGFPTDSDNVAAFLSSKNEDSSSDRPFIAGILKVDSETEIQTSEQKHIVIATESTDEPTLEVIGILTSEKGNTFLAGVTTTIKVADTQEISGDLTKGQYAKTLVPPYSVDTSLFEEHEKATHVVNTPEYRNKLDDMREQAEEFEPIVYSGIGITKDHLLAIEAVMDAQEVAQKTATNEKEEIGDPGDDAAI